MADARRIDRVSVATMDESRPTVGHPIVYVVVEGLRRLHERIAVALFANQSRDLGPLLEVVAVRQDGLDERLLPGSRQRHVENDRARRSIDTALTVARHVG
jgi:hypothetical protein